MGARGRAHGIRHDLVATVADLTASVAEPPRGIRVLEVTVDRSTHRRAHADLRALAAGSLL